MELLVVHMMVMVGEINGTVAAVVNIWDVQKQVITNK
jgi:hypothetical protein